MRTEAEQGQEAWPPSGRGRGRPQASCPRRAGKGISLQPWGEQRPSWLGVCCRRPDAVLGCRALSV